MIRVRIPATTANLGPGFDCMGLALDLWNTFELTVGDAVNPEDPRIKIHGEGASILPTDDSNLVVQIFREELGDATPERFQIICHNEIPCASGLGSSSTGVLAGLLFAAACRNFARGEDPADIDQDEILAAAVSREGHGDNVAPALLGGFVIVVPDDSGVLTQRVPYVPLKAVLCVPEFDYLTSDARKALPTSYSREDAIFNIGRSMLVAEALRFGDYDLLARAMNDRIHQPYRLKAIPGAESALQAAKSAGAICCALSGAGPGLIAFTQGKFDPIGRAMKSAYSVAGLQSRYWILEASDDGAKIGRLPV